jgi:SAM-dependent methyltransferase
MSAALPPQDDELSAAKAMTIQAYSELASVRAELTALKESRSWKMTAPYRWLGARLKTAPKEPVASIHRDARDLSSSYYQNLHDTHPAYQGNNWLVAELSRLLLCRPATVLEVGCGNGRFLREVAPHVQSVVGADWAISPLTVDMPHNVKLMKLDVAKEAIPSADLVCSADVLEHFAPESINTIIGKLHISGKYNYHVIACYDDLHSHLTIVSPGEWLHYFQRHSPLYRIVEIRPRHNNPIYPVCVIANF